MKKTLSIIIIVIVTHSSLTAAVYNNINPDDIQNSSIIISSIHTNTQKYNFHSLISSTYLGGSYFDGGLNIGIASDNNGYIFVTGVTSSIDFPTTIGTYDNSYNGGSDIFISKFNNDLTHLVSSTFIGGSSDDETNHRCITVDNNGNVLLTGITNSADFPITNNSYDTSYNGNQDIFIMKLNNNLTSVLCSSFLGGSSIDGSRCDVTIDTNKCDDIYVSGMTKSHNFPTTPNAYLNNYIGGGCDVFISKFDNNLSSLISSTFFGGNENEECPHVCIDPDENIFISGFTSSSDLPTTNGVYDETFNGIEDTFTAKFNGDLSNLIACTYIGSRKYDNAYAMNVDIEGNILLGGHADLGFPTTKGAYMRFGFLKGFISKISGDLTTLVASTFFGRGLYSAYVSDIDSYSDGNIYVTGYTRSIFFKTTPDGFDRRHNGGVDVFFSVLHPDLSLKTYSTYIGGSGDDEIGSAMVINNDGTVCISSGTSSSDFPTTPGAYDETYNGGVDCFILKLDIKK